MDTPAPDKTATDNNRILNLITFIVSKPLSPRKGVFTLNSNFRIRVPSVPFTARDSYLKKAADKIAAGG